MSSLDQPLASFPRHRRGSAKALLLAIGLVIVLLLAAFFGGMHMATSDSADKEHGDLLLSMTGLANPLKNKLAAEYTDADNNLVADAPTDASKFIDPTELVFSYVASEENTAKFEAIFKPFTDAITAATGKPVKYLAITSVDAELNALHDGQLQLCAINTGAVPNAVDVAGFVPVSVIGGDSGPSTYELKIIASTKSGLTSVEALRGRELTLTDMNSNSGYKAPLVLLQKKFKMRPGFDFGIRYSQGYASSIEGLANGTFEAIAVASDVLARAEAAGTIKAADYKVLFTSDPFPKACFGFAHNLKPELVNKLRPVMSNFAMSGEASAAFFGVPGKTILVPVDYAKDFALIREIDDTIGYQHKLRPAVAADDLTSPSTAPATQPAM